MSGKLGRTAKFYRKNKKSYEKKLKKDRARSVSKEGLRYRAKHKRMRNAAKKKYGEAAIKGKDIEKNTGKPVSPKVNRARREKSRLKGSTRGKK